MVKKEVGSRIRNIRKAAKLNQKEFGKRLNISDASLSEIETGKFKPGFDVLMNLVNEFNANLYYVFLGKGEIFLDPAVSLPGRIEEFAVNVNHVRKFLYHFERSPFIQYAVLTQFREMLTKNSEVISQELDEYEKKQIDKT
ncbi:helix-turn-helix domain-containing protein [Acidobacteriota bacterium]